MAFEEGPDLGSRLAEWPVNHCVKVLAPIRADDPAELTAYNEREIVRLADACRRTGHEFLFEIISGNSGNGRWCCVSGYVRNCLSLKI